MPDRKFTLKDFKRIKEDIFNDFFERNSANYDLKELMKANLLGNEDNVPLGYHRMPDGSLMPDEEMTE